eukprot:8713445-Ditylum_brightwellii.AAC.1
MAQAQGNTRGKHTQIMADSSGGKQRRESNNVLIKEKYNQSHGPQILTTLGLKWEEAMWNASCR